LTFSVTVNSKSFITNTRTLTCRSPGTGFFIPKKTQQNSSSDKKDSCDQICMLLLSQACDSYHFRDN